jgi:hypothetical protein
MKYGPTINNLNMIVDKAKTKKNGIYSFRGLKYLVKDGEFTYFAYGGEVIMRGGHFNFIVARYYRDAKEALKRFQD